MATEAKKPVCSNKAQIVVEGGKVSFGDGCIISPKAKIIVEGDCSIIFGEYNIIEENVVIKASPRYSALLNNNETVTVYIGNYNHFKVGAYLMNTSVENYNVFDYNCHLEESYVESKSIITAGISLPKRASIKSGSIVIDNQIIRVNNHFNENEFISSIKELYKILSAALNKKHK